jgi:hypothetical protein
MHFRRSLLAAAALATATAPGLAQETGFSETVRLMQRVATQYTILLTRMFVDLTYESIAIEPGTNDLIVTGLRLYPELAWDQDGRCEIVVERAVIADTNSVETLRTAVELGGVALPPACFQPEVAATLAGLGYDGLTADAATLDIAYDLPSSAADLAVQVSVVDAAEIALTAHFDYLFLRFPIAADTGATDTEPMEPEGAAAEPVPVARLGWAELVVENDGLWQALEPMMTTQMGDLNALPQMVQMGVGELFTEGGTRTPTPEETAFVDNLASEVARFIADRDRIVVTAAPEGGSVLLTGEMMASPGALIVALDPVVSAASRAHREMIAPADLAAALAGGDALDAKARLRIGRALVTGIGAPRAAEAGRALLLPLAEEWNAAAALLTARAAESAGDPQTAYAMALRAMAGGEAGSIALADALEPELPLIAIVAAQDEAVGAWPGAADAQAEAERLIAEGDVTGMRRRAYATATGTGRPRHYGHAYYWASLAAAAGDRGAASLRQRLDDRFAGQEGWQAIAENSATAALETWTAGLGETIAASVRR